MSLLQHTHKHKSCVQVLTGCTFTSAFTLFHFCVNIAGSAQHIFELVVWKCVASFYFVSSCVSLRKCFPLAFIALFQHLRWQKLSNDAHMLSETFGTAEAKEWIRERERQRFWKVRASIQLCIYHSGHCSCTNSKSIGISQQNTVLLKLGHFYPYGRWHVSVLKQCATTFTAHFQAKEIAGKWILLPMP